MLATDHRTGPDMSYSQHDVIRTSNSRQQTDDGHVITCYVEVLSTDDEQMTAAAAAAA